MYQITYKEARKSGENFVFFLASWFPHLLVARMENGRVSCLDLLGVTSSSKLQNCIVRSQLNGVRWSMSFAHDGNVRKRIVAADVRETGIF